MYLLLENEARDSMHKSHRPCYFPEPIKILKESMQRSNSKAVVGLQFYSFKHPQAEEQVAAGGWDDGVCKTRIEPGQYMSITQDGKLSYWTEHMKHMYTLKLDDLKQAHAVLYQKIWVTDMMCMRNIDLLAISSTSSHLEFYDISARKCNIAFTLTGVEPVTVMDYWSDGKRAVFSIGDVSGCVTIFTSCDVVQNGIFNRRTSKTGSNCHITMADLLKNRSNNHFCFKVAVHGNNCQNVRFLAKLHVIASCAACDKSAMVLTSVPESHKSEVHHSVFSLPKGIMCFDYTPELNVLVTGGSDRMVRVWNPYVTKRACSRMEGHLSVITDIVANGRDKKVISISKDKNLRVWDLQDYTCLQKIRPSEIPMGRPPITAIHYTRETNTLVIATSLVVSGCYSGLVCVWDILTGEKVMQFRTSPKRGTDMTAMSFDGPQRRLITGSSDGAVCLWNFNNGVLLLKLPLLDRDEVTGILHVNNKIYMNIRKEVKMEYSVWRRYHTEDIFSMNAYGNKMLVTASYNGDIIVWNTSTEEPLCWFNAAESPKPMLMDNLKEKASQMKRRSPKQSPTESVSSQAELKQERVSPRRQGTPKQQGAGTGRFSSRQSDPMQDEGVDNEEGDGGQEETEEAMPNLVSPEELAKPLRAVEKTLFLGTRSPHPDTAILLTSATDGYIYAWSICDQGGLLGKFKPTQGEDSVRAMSTDPTDRILLTGDGAGIITLWDIEDFCIAAKKEEAVAKENGAEDTDLSPKDSEEEELGNMTEQETEMWDGFSISISPPKLLTSWQCHLRRILQVEFVAHLDLIITTSLDCNVRLWTFTGTYIGTFGQVQWRVEEPSTFPRELPADLRRLAVSQSNDLEDEANPEEPYEGGPQETQTPGAPGSATVASDKSKSIDALPELCPSQYCSKKVEQTWREWLEKGKESKILGQAYKPKVTHVRLPGHLDLQTTSTCHDVVRVSKFLPCSPLLPIPEVSMPDILKKQQKTQEDTETLGKQKCRKKPCSSSSSSSSSSTGRMAIISALTHAISAQPFSQ
ncbi:hypothetical protein AGOR_G00054940 [Albula goreensis]|uniref:WD repeat-containing protein on Y chromosome n=1 Tax=Albula goreensis TaxID=1534307 RepID=A0A8T3DYL9_9TELE|nr:hypothetical protein AGOR_G00054940 [Albula goreensis]